MSWITIAGNCKECGGIVIMSPANTRLADYNWTCINCRKSEGLPDDAECTFLIPKKMYIKQTSTNSIDITG